MIQTHQTSVVEMLQIAILIINLRPENIQANNANYPPASSAMPIAIR